MATAVFVAFFAWIQARYGWREMLAPWRDFPSTDLAAVVGLTAAAYLVRAWRLYLYYRDNAAGAYPLFLRINTLHTAFVNLLPMRIGEAAFPILMKRHLARRYLHSTADLVWLRFADLWALLLIGVAAFAVARGGALWALALGWAMLPAAVSLSRARIARGSTSPGPWLRAGLDALAQSIPARAGLTASLLALTLATWLLKLAAFTHVLFFFAGSSSVALLPGVIAAEISNALPIQGLAGFGTFELALLLGASAAPVPGELLLAAAVNLHLFVLGCTVVFALLALMLPSGRTAPRPGGGG